MAVSYKNIVITPNISNTAEPIIQFKGANASVNTDVQLRVLPDDGGIVEFEKSDNTAIFTISANSKLTIANNIKLIANGSAGGSGEVLASNTTGVYWKAITDLNTTYNINAVSGTGYANLRLLGVDSSTDDVKFVGSGATTVSQIDSDTIQISSTDTNTTYAINSVANATSANIILVPSSGSNTQLKVLGSGGIVANSDGTNITVYINASASYTWSNAHTFNANLTANDVVINGNLTVSGTTTYVNSTQLNIGDNIISLNADVTNATAPTQNAGLEINRGSSANVYMQYNETADNWEITNDGTNYIALKAGNSTIVANSSGIFANASAIDTNTTYTINAISGSGYANVRILGSDSSTDDIKFVGSGSVSVAQTDSNTITITGTDNNTTYDHLAVSGSGYANLRLHASTNANDDVKLVGSGYVSVAYTDDDTITITGTATSPAGSNTFIQYNNSGVFGANAQFAYASDVAQFSIGNTASTLAPVLVVANSSGSANLLSNKLNVGANASMNTTAVFIGNTSVNSYFTQQTAAFNSNSTVTAFYVASNGNVGVSTSTPTYNLQVNGTFAAITKSFLIDHPVKKGWKLRYGSLESPYHGIRLTGSGEITNGKVKIDLPKYVKNLVHPEDAQVQLTNYKHGKILWVDSIDTEKNSFTVKMDREKGDKEGYKFFWSFTAIRKDIEEMIVEFEDE